MTQERKPLRIWPAEQVPVQPGTWINVADRLPEIGQEVWVMFSNDRGELKRWIGVITARFGNGFDSKGAFSQIGKIVTYLVSLLTRNGYAHWQPVADGSLPEPITLPPVRRSVPFRKSVKPTKAFEPEEAETVKTSNIQTENVKRGRSTRNVSAEERERRRERMKKVAQEYWAKRRAVESGAP